MIMKLRLSTQMSIVSRIFALTKVTLKCGLASGVDALGHLRTTTGHLNIIFNLHRSFSVSLTSRLN